MTALDLSTKGDIDSLRKELAEIKELISSPSQASEWLRTEEVLEHLSCKRDYLIKLRAEGRIMSVKIGGIVYYNVQSFYDHLASLAAPVRAA